MGIKEFQAPQNKKMSNMINGEEIASFIVDLLGGDSPAQDYLTKLMNSFESYYHPSNIGFHSVSALISTRCKSDNFSSRKNCSNSSKT